LKKSEFFNAIGALLTRERATRRRVGIYEIID
jgi:hypothetical protein